MKYRHLLIYDASALAVAKRGGWVLLSGDKPLWKAAGAECVECRGTIWICDQLKYQGIITDEKYRDLIDELIEAVKNGNFRLTME